MILEAFLGARARSRALHPIRLADLSKHPRKCGSGAVRIAAVRLGRPGACLHRRGERGDGSLKNEIRYVRRLFFAPHRVYAET